MICTEWELGKMTTKEAKANFREYIVDDSEIHLHALFQAIAEENEERKDE